MMADGGKSGVWKEKRAPNRPRFSAVLSIRSDRCGIRKRRRVMKNIQEERARSKRNGRISGDYDARRSGSNLEVVILLFGVCLLRCGHLELATRRNRRNVRRRARGPEGGDRCVPCLHAVSRHLVRGGQGDDVRPRSVEESRESVEGG
jgi:hypothetical protein